MKEHIKERIVETALKACGEKLFTGTSGNLSEYDRENRLMLITPSGLDYTIMKSADIVIMDLDGKIMEGKLKPSSEWRLHAELYRALDHVNAIIHTHSPFATAFAVLHESIPLVLTAMLQYPGGEVPLAEYALPGTEQVGINALNAMRNCNCIATATAIATAAFWPIMASWLREQPLKKRTFVRSIRKTPRRFTTLQGRSGNRFLFL